ncbi:thioesterase II family protein [Nonomuraea pusilla]|uniref:Alpha/beta hydrolase family protein n=1 Tax=Nonomuraea pusilla TaxID=46177 RepID=A0A1H8IF63_9ACTN|nr:hypothetical protein [Nonomuraea pusilla]SEN66796.1 hypothetical protein SAMN05660976_08030 [Nonomuraea pusilla]
MPDARLFGTAVELGGVPAAVADHEALRARVTRVPRAGLEWPARYRLPRPEPLPVVALAGSRDPLAGPEVVRRWARLSSEASRPHVVDGGHLFHLDNPSAVTSLIADRLG